MKSTRRIIAVLAGAAMLAMPVTAAAARNHDNARASGGSHASAPRTFAASRNFDTPRANVGARANFNTPRAFNSAPARARASTFAGFRSFNQVNATPRPAFAEPRFTAQVEPRVWNRPAVAAPATPYYAPGIVRVHHYEPDDDDYGPGYYGSPAVVEDECPGGYYQGSYYAPSSYYFEQAPGESLSAYMNHLLYARQMAWIKYQNALARGDYKGAKHLYRAYVSLNNQIARVRGRYGYAAAPVPPAYAAPAPYGAYGAPVGPSPLGSLLGGNTGGLLGGLVGGGYGNYAPSPAGPAYAAPGYQNNYGYNPSLGYNPAYANYGNPNPGYGTPYGGYNNGGLTTMLGPLMQQFVH